MLHPVPTTALISGILCLCLPTTDATAARQIHVAQVLVRCLDGEGDEKPEAKLTAAMAKRCEGKHRCSAVWRFAEPRNCLRTKRGR